MSKCKVTVIKKFFDKEASNKYLKNPPEECPFFSVGDTFIIDEKVEMPKGFCSGAWSSAVEKFAFALVHGAGGFFENNWMKDENKLVTCCNDGFRPVSFLLERIDD